MCGIVGIKLTDGQPIDSRRLAAMRDTMVHRGPDGAGIHIDGSVGLGHRRLAIIDRSNAGHQPMCNEDQTVWLIFNGEIYNYAELTVDLRKRGHQFRSHTDSEVILHLWEEVGERCLDQLNGMFSFILWDSRRQEFFGARDRAGIKPFLYYQGPDRFIAASDARAILADPTVTPQPDLQGISDALLTNYPQGHKTCFRGIRQLPPGWALSLRHGELRTWQYWDVPFRYDTQRTLDDTVEELAWLLDDAMRIQCRSDAPLGCHLSGGLDSSTVAAFTARHYRPLHTFSIRFEGGRSFDESPFAHAVARHVGSSHHEATPGPEDFASLLGHLAGHSDSPMPDISTFSYYTVARLASSHVKVALTGHGGDEVFAGYPAQFQAAFGDTSMFEQSPRVDMPVSLARRVHLAVRRHGLMGAVSHALRQRLSRPKEDLESLWLRLHCGFAPLDNPLLLPGFRRSLAGYDSRVEYLAPLRQARTEFVLDRCLYHDLRSYLPGLLHQEDRASMAVSLESRVPLLDHRLIEFLATVPPDQKVAGRQPKAALRRVARQLIPAEVVSRRDKGAFPVPIPLWFSRQLKPLLDEIIFTRAALDRGIFDPVELRSGWHGQAGYWNALSLELWFKLFIDRDRKWLDRAGQPPASLSPAESDAGVRDSLTTLPSA